MLHPVSPYYNISKIFHQLPSSIRSALCCLEKTLSPISPYTCYWLQRSMLWVVSSGSLITSVSPTHAWALALDVMEYRQAKAKSSVMN